MEKEKNKIEYEKQLNSIRLNKIIELNNWWGLHYPGQKGTIITANKEVYEYQFFNHIVPKYLEGKEVNYIVKTKTLTDKEYKKLINFLEKDLLLKETGIYHIHDASYKVDAKITKYGIHKVSYNDIDLYKYVEKFIKELIK